jgi:hypothetical protein
MMESWKPLRHLSKSWSPAHQKYTLVPVVRRQLAASDGSCFILPDKTCEDTIYGGDCTADIPLEYADAGVDALQLRSHNTLG